MGKLINLLYCGLSLPEGISILRILQLRQAIFNKLHKEMQKEHVWLAVCTVAVEAGRWRGERLRTRRIKLLSMINVCQDYLGEPPVIPFKGWEMTGLYYGYGAVQEFASDQGIPAVLALGIGQVNANPESAPVVASILAEILPNDGEIH